MRLEFQKNIASSQFTLPFVCTLGIILWIVLPTAHSGQTTSWQFGLWSLIPTNFLTSTGGKFIALALSALSVYLVAELTNSNVLLRISSRMLSSTLALLMGITLCMHIPTPGHVIMIFTILSFFALFSTYQLALPVPSFIIYLMLSIGSLVFPKLLYFVPVYWGCQMYLRSFSARTLLASVFGTLLPYWFLFGISVQATGGTAFFLSTCKEMISLHMPDYSSLQLTDILIFTFAVAFFVFGMIDFYLNAYLDKTRTRIIFNVIITHTIITVLFMVLQPQYFHILLPLLLVDSALVGGHFIALTYSKFSHIYCIVALACIIALLTAQIIL